MTIQKYILGAKSPTFLFENLGKRCIRYTVSLIPVYQKYREGAPISNAPYKQHLGKIGDFDGSPYKQQFHNWQFDVSLLEMIFF